jgi:hypothetical protein
VNVLKGNCPACGAGIEFKRGSTIVVVCDYCRSVVARTDRALEDLGKVAELMETGSPLEIGVRGSYNNVGFEITGRAQLIHEAGGVWDEWYATFSNGWVGWLAEAQGRFYMSFYFPMPEGQTVPPFESLNLGQPVREIPYQVPLMVAEKGVAIAAGAKGEIPYTLTPNEQYYYADLSGAKGAFGTIDYGSTPPRVFVGQQVTLDELGIKGVKKEEHKQWEATVGVAHLNCPNCGGGIDLRAPDRTERVTCPNCNSLLDVNEGNLKYLHALKPAPFQPCIPIGTTGTLIEEQPQTIIGFVARSVEIYGERYFWTEYLLYNPRIGFRWLVHSDNHWNFVRPLPPGDVIDSGNTTHYDGTTFKIFQDAPAFVEHVTGEFYWRVEVGERVQATDYVKAPLMLSKEVSVSYVQNKKKKAKDTGEINWSLGTYVPVKDVEKAFNVQDLPKPYNIAPNQPFPHKWIYKYWLLFLPILLVVGLFMTIIGGTSNKVVTYDFTLQPLANEDATQVVFSEQRIELLPRRNISITVTAPVDNTWVALEGDLINDETGLVQSFPIELSYYKGVEDGESWSEGKTSDYIYLSSLPGGKYTMRIEAQWGGEGATVNRWKEPMPLTVTVEQNSTRGVNLIIALIVISIIPIIVIIWHIVFESRRWSESMFSGSGDEE